jgi:hypothetical protein
VNVSGSIDTYGNNGGVPGSAGVNGTNGTQGASNTYFALGLNFGYRQGPTEVSLDDALELGLQVTIDNVTVGFVVWDSVSLISGGLVPSAFGLYVNEQSPSGATVFNFDFNVSESNVNFTETINGQTTYLSYNPVTYAFENTPLSSFITNVDGTTGPFTYTTTPSTYPYTSNSAYTPISSTGSSTSTTNGIAATTAGNGGNVQIIAGKSLTVGGVVNALGGENVAYVTECCYTTTAQVTLGPGGAINLQAPSITVTGTGISSTSTATVAGGSVNFITQYNGIDFLVKPVEYAALTWTTAANLNIGNGTGVIIATSPVTLIQNATGSVDLSDVNGVDLFASSSTYSTAGDLVIVANGNIIASGAVNPATLSAGSATIPGQIILAAGDQAAAATYGISTGNSVFLILGLGSTTGGAINLPNVAVGDSNTAMVYLHATSGTATGFISTGTVTAASTNNTFPGTIHAVSDGDILTPVANAGMLFLVSANGSIGTSQTPLVTDASYISAQGATQAQINSTASQVNVLSSNAGTLGIAAVNGSIIVQQQIGGYTVSLNGVNGLLLNDLVLGSGADGIVNIVSGLDITDSIGISKIESPNVFLSTIGSISLSSFATESSIVLQAAGTNSSVTATTLNSELVGVLSGTGGITIGSTSAAYLVLNATGDVTAHATSSVLLGGPVGLFSLGNNFTLTADGHINITGAVQAYGVLSLSTTNNSDIIIEKNLIGGTSVVLHMEGTGGVVASSGYIQTPLLDISSTSGNFGSLTDQIFSNASTIRYATTGSIYLFNTNANGVLLPDNWSGGSFYLVQNGPATVSGKLTASGDIAMAAIVGSLTIAADMEADGQITLITGDPTGNGANQDLVINANLQSVSTMTLGTSQASKLTLGGGYLIAGSNVVLESPTLLISGQVYSNGGDLTVVYPSATNAIDVQLVDNGVLMASHGNLNLNIADYNGAVTVSGAGFIGAQFGQTYVYGGSGDVNMTVKAFDGTLTVTGGAISLKTTEADLSNVSVSGTSIGFDSSGNANITIVGSITIADSTAHGGTATLTLSGTGALGGGGTITAESVNLISDQGFLGSGSTPIYLDATYLALTTKSSAYVANIGDLTLKTSDIGASLLVSSPTAITVPAASTVIAGEVVFDTPSATIEGQLVSTQNGITFNDDYGSPLIIVISGSVIPENGQINLNGSGNDVTYTTNSLSGVLTASGNNVSLNVLSGDIANVTVTANSLAFSAPGDVFIETNGSIEVLGSTAGSGKVVEISTTNDGSITVSGAIDTTGPADLSNLHLAADGTGNITATAMLVADTISLNSMGGAVGSEQTPVLLETSNLEVNANSAYIAVNGAVTLTDSYVENQLSLNVDGALTTTGNIFAGDIDFDSSDAMTAGALTAHNGSIDLHSSTSILVSANATISAVGTTPGTGKVRIYTTDDPGLEPGNVPNDVAVTDNSGELFFNNGITAVGATNNIVVTEGQVLFDTESPSGITLGGGVTINGTANQAPFFRINSLDLTSPLAVANIVALQNLGVVGGQLIVNGQGVAIGGNAVLNPIVLGTLSALNIPQNVTLSYIGFSRLTPVNIELTSASSTKQVLVDGTQRFRGVIFHPIMNVESNQAGPVLLLGETGTITASGGMTLFTNGIIDLQGSISSRLSLKISRPGLSQDLGIVMHDGSTISSSHGSLLFNTGFLGAVSISGEGVLTSGRFGNVEFLNVGGSLNVQAKAINGKVIATGSAVSIATTSGDLNVGSIFPISPSAATTGGPVLLSAGGGTLTVRNVASVGLLHGGSISLYGSKGIKAGIVSTSALLGHAGTISLRSPHDIEVKLLSASSVLGKGGQITADADNLFVSHKDFLGNSISAASVFSNGGSINIKVDHTFTVGSVTSNGTKGNINVNGAIDGGYVTITGPAIEVNGSVTANGGSGAGGRILLQNPQVPVFIVRIDGLVQAKNDADDSGRVGINTGACCMVAQLLGTGTLHGGEFVSFGNIARTSLRPLSTPGGDLYRSDKVNISNRFLSNPGICVVPPEPEAPDNQTEVNSGDLTDGSSSNLGGRIATDTTFVGISTDSTQRNPPSSFPGQGNHTDSDPPQPEQVLDGISEFNAGVISTLQNSGLNVALGPVANILRLLQGQLLITPGSQVGVQTNEGQVNIAPGATALVMETGNDVAVYNLNDHKVGDVNVIVGNRKLTVAPGQELVLTRMHNAAFDKVNPGTHIAYRNPKKIRVNPDVTAFYSEFSIASAITADRGMRRLMSSSDPKERNLASRLMKMAAIRQMVAQNSGPYRKSGGT